MEITGWNKSELIEWEKDIPDRRGKNLTLGETGTGEIIALYMLYNGGSKEQEKPKVTREGEPRLGISSWGGSELEWGVKLVRNVVE